MVTQQLRELGLSQTIEIFIDVNTVSKFRFSDSLINLDNIVVTAIGIGDFNIIKSPTNRTILNWDKLYSSYLTLMGYDSNLFNDKLPLYLFIRNDFDVLFLKPKKISFRNSYIEIPDVSALVIPAGGYSVVFTVFYENYDPLKHKFDKSGELIEPEN